MTLLKFGYAFTSNGPRFQVEKFLMRNTDMGKNMESVQERGCTVGTCLPNIGKDCTDINLMPPTPHLWDWYKRNDTGKSFNMKESEITGITGKK